jgi:hypothetical protein
MTTMASLKFRSDQTPAVEESLRQVALSLAKIHKTRGIRGVIVTSAGSEDGATAMTIEIARHLRDSINISPLVVQIRSHLNGAGQSSRPGAPDLLDLCNGQSLESCIEKGAHGLSFVRHNCGPESKGETGQLQAALAKLLESNESDYDLALLSTPPFLASANTLVVGEVAPHLVLHVRSGKVRYEVLQRVTRDLGDHNIELLGTVLDGPKRIIPSWFYRLFLK